MSLNNLLLSISELGLTQSNAGQIRTGLPAHSLPPSNISSITAAYEHDGREFNRYNAYRQPNIQVNIPHGNRRESRFKIPSFSHIWR